MTLNDPTFWLLAIPAVIITGISKGGFAGGIGFVAVPMMAMALGPVRAAAVMLPLLMFMDLLGLRAYWGRWDRRQALALALAAIPGIILGYVLFGLVSEAAVKVALGAISLCFTAFSIARSRGWIAPNRIDGVDPNFIPRAGLWGAVAGFTSFVAHAGGPPVAMHLLTQNVSKTVYQATTVAFFFCVNIMKAPFYGGLGLFAMENLSLSLLLAPFAAIGMLIGVRAHDLIPERLFFAIAYVALTLIGTKLLLEGLGLL